MRSARPSVGFAGTSSGARSIASINTRTIGLSGANLIELFLYYNTVGFSDHVFQWSNDVQPLKTRNTFGLSTTRQVSAVQITSRSDRLNAQVPQHVLNDILEAGADRKFDENLYHPSYTITCILICDCTIIDDRG